MEAILLSMLYRQLYVVGLLQGFPTLKEGIR